MNPARMFIDWSRVLHAAETDDGQGGKVTFVTFEGGHIASFRPGYDSLVFTSIELCTTPATESELNSAMIAPAASLSKTARCVPSASDMPNSIFSAFTRTLAPVLRKISKVFMRRQRVRATCVPQSR